MKLSHYDVLILAGGQGSRIRHLMPDNCPKIMADVNGQPFVDILMRHLRSKGFRRFVLLTGYGLDRLSAWRAGQGADLGGVIFCHEDTALGTGGAICAAEILVKSDPFFVLNGDTLLDIDYADMAAWHMGIGGMATVAADGHHRHCGAFVLSRSVFGMMRGRRFPYCVEEIFAEMGRRHKIVNWYHTEDEFWDIGTPGGLEAFRQRVRSWGQIGESRQTVR